MRRLLGWLVVTAVAAGCASSAPTEPRTEIPITDVKMLAGNWVGYIVFDNGNRLDNVTVTISDQGTAVTSGKSFTTNSEITTANGKASYRSTRSSGTATLFKVGSKEILRFQGSNASGSGYGEYTRTN